MFGVMIRSLTPSSLQLSGKFDANVMKALIFKRQPISFCVSKVLHARNKRAALQSKDIAMDRDETDGPVSTTPSIVAKRIYQNRNETGYVEDDHNLFQSAEDLRSKLEDLTTKIKDKLSAENITESWKVLPEQRETNKYDAKSHSVEQLIFKDDFLMQPKPSTLLGTEDPSIPASEIPCVGCGAMLQCYNRVLPGFMPSEKFKLTSEKELKTSICQRCYYIQHHDIFCTVSVSPDHYASMISRIQNVKSIVVMVVDVLDIPGSIVPNLMDYIGQKHPIIVVGNKADLLAPDSPDYLANAREELKKACYSAGYSNIRKVVFVSAKTGFGVEKLINLLFSYYKYRVDVFIVGTANAGKSSLFNALLASDYCKHTVRDLIERATVSVWPGTTLNFLKFPVMRPSSRTVSLRRKRLKQEEAIRKEMKKMSDQRKKEKQNTWELNGQMNKTDVRTDNQRKEDIKEEAWGQEIAGYKGGKTGGITLPSSLPAPSSFEEDNYPDSYWMYDTPGVINPEQVMNLLEPNELSHVSPVNMIIPQCVLLKPGTTLFVSGLSRLDFVKGDDALIATIHCSSSLPLKIVPTVEANEFYKQNVGTPLLGIPLGDKSRLDKIPALEMKEFNFVGEKDFLAVADIQFSSIGWVSVAPKAGSRATLHAFTPGGKGIALRTQPLAPRYTHFRGKRISRTPFFHTQTQGSVMIGKTLSREEK